MILFYPRNIWRRWSRIQVWTKKGRQLNWCFQSTLEGNYQVRTRIYYEVYKERIINMLNSMPSNLYKKCHQRERFILRNFWSLVFSALGDFICKEFVIFAKKKHMGDCGPRISAQCVSHSMAKLDFYLKNDFCWLRKIDLESPLIFVLFLKGKQNKKEKP